MNKKRHQLRLIGITYNQIESGVYAVILEEVNGLTRIPIVIGYPEAQAIECHLQNVRTPRPLTHDLIKKIMDEFQLKLSCIDIHKLPSGVFAADLVMEGPDGELHKIDSRSSDAISLAIRCNAPIYTSSEVLEESGFRPQNLSSEKQELNNPPSAIPVRIEDFDSLGQLIENGDGLAEEINKVILEFLENFSDKEIEVQIGRFATEERYEVAARLKSILSQRHQAK